MGSSALADREDACLIRGLRPARPQFRALAAWTVAILKVAPWGTQAKAAALLVDMVTGPTPGTGTKIVPVPSQIGQRAQCRRSNGVYWRTMAVAIPFVSARCQSQASWQTSLRSASRQVRSSLS